MKWLTLQDLELIHIQIIDASGGSHGTRDTGRLESALAAMRQETFGQELYPAMYEKAAALTRGIIADHPYVDGNKRTGMMAALLFLNLNEVDTAKIADKDLEDFAVKIAVDRLSIPEIAKWFEGNCDGTRKKPSWKRFAGAFGEDAFDDTVFEDFEKIDPKM